MLGSILRVTMYYPADKYFLCQNMLQFYLNKQGDVQLATSNISVDIKRELVCLVFQIVQKLDHQTTLIEIMWIPL